jgi:hypothetical protein
MTEVDITWYEGQIEHWIRFGAVADERIIDRRRRVLGFQPGSVFALVRWASNDYGTARSEIVILRAIEPGEVYTTTALVRPGGDILLSTRTWTKVRQVLQAIDAVEAIGVEAADAAPDHWRHVHNRIAAGQPPRLYTPARHRAWTLRRELQP